MGRAVVTRVRTVYCPVEAAGATGPNSILADGLFALILNQRARASVRASQSNVQTYHDGFISEHTEKVKRAEIDYFLSINVDFATSLRTYDSLLALHSGHCNITRNQGFWLPLFTYLVHFLKEVLINTITSHVS